MPNTKILRRNDVIENHSVIQPVEAGKFYNVTVIFDADTSFILETVNADLEPIERFNGGFYLIAIKKFPYKYTFRCNESGNLALHYNTNILNWTNIKVTVEEQ